MSNEELDRIALDIYQKLEPGDAARVRSALLSLWLPELEELRRFKAAALTLTTEASVNHVMAGHKAVINPAWEKLGPERNFQGEVMSKEKT